MNSITQPVKPNDNIDEAFGISWIGYVIVVTVVTVCTALNLVLSRWLSLTDLAMIYLLGVVFIAAYCRRTLSTIGAVLCFIAFDFFFVPPIYTLRFASAEHLTTGLVLLVVSISTSVLASRVRESLMIAHRAAIVANEERLRNSVLASLSHDLRTPLSVIAGSASSLRENRSRLSTEEQDQLLDTIFQQSRVMSLDVSDLLEMTRLHSGPVKLDLQWHSLEELIGAAAERCKTVLAPHHLSIVVPPDTPLIFVDGVLLEKLFVNLFENSSKYTLPGSHIHVGVSHTTQAIEVRVEDDGPGLPADSAQLLFKKFSRGTLEGSSPGSGLGLSICQAIAHLHNMTISAHNRPLGGAQFVLTVPYTPPPSAQDIQHERA